MTGAGARLGPRADLRSCPSGPAAATRASGRPDDRLHRRRAPSTPLHPESRGLHRPRPDDRSGHYLTRDSLAGDAARPPVSHWAAGTTNKASLHWRRKRVPSYRDGNDLDTCWTDTSRPVVASSTFRAVNGASRCTRTRSLQAGHGGPDATMPTSLMLITVADSMSVTGHGGQHLPADLLSG